MLGKGARTGGSHRVGDGGTANCLGMEDGAKQGSCGEGAAPPRMSGGRT